MVRIFGGGSLLLATDGADILNIRTSSARLPIGDLKCTGNIENSAIITDLYSASTNTFARKVETDSEVRFDIKAAPYARIHTPMTVPFSGRKAPAIWIATTENDLLRIVLIGNGFFDGDAVVCRCGTTHILISGGLDPAAIDASVVRCISAAERGTSADFSVRVGEEADNPISYATEVLKNQRTADGFVASSLDDPRADILTQCLAALALDRMGERKYALKLAETLIGLDELSWYCGASKTRPDANPNSLTSSLIALTALRVFTNPLNRRQIDALVVLLQKSVSLLRMNMMPFNGSEHAERAQLYPNQGSATATALFIESVKQTQTRFEREGLELPNKISMRAADAAAHFHKHFVSQGIPMTNAPERLDDLAGLPKYRFGRCPLCRSGVDKWLYRIPRGEYICLDCFDSAPFYEKRSTWNANERSASYLLPIRASISMEAISLTPLPMKTSSGRTPFRPRPA